MSRFLTAAYALTARLPGARAILWNNGVQRLLQLFLRSVRLNVRTEAGFSLRLDILDIRVANEIRRTGLYEPAFSRAFLEYLRPGMTVVDAGANAGYYTLLSAMAVDPDGCVLAFEPDARVLPLLRENIARNECANVRVIEAALSDKEGTSSLYVAPHAAISSIIPASVRGGKAVACVMHSLDACLAREGIPRVDVIKMDVQGAELRCLQGARGTIGRNRNIALFMEFWPDGLRAAGSDPVDLLRFLAEQGFDIECIEGGIPHHPVREAEAFTAAVGAMSGESYNCYVNLRAHRPSS